MKELTQSKRLYLIPVLFLALGMMMFLVATQDTVEANEPGTNCGQGEAQSALQAMGVGLHILNDSRAGLGTGSTDCRYTIWEEGQTFTFETEDYIIGATVNFIPLQLLGVSPSEARDILRESEDSVLIGPVGMPIDQLEAQVLQESAFKSTIHPTYGHIIYQVKGFVIQLEPGDYTSRFEWRWPLLTGDDSLQVNTNTLHIEP